MVNKVTENRMRRKAERQGLKLAKSRRRDPDALDYGTYWLVDAATSIQVLGDEWGADFEDVVDYLHGGEAERQD